MLRIVLKVALRSRGTSSRISNARRLQRLAVAPTLPAAPFLFRQVLSIRVCGKRGRDGSDLPPNSGRVPCRPPTLSGLAANLGAGQGPCRTGNEPAYCEAIRVQRTQVAP